MLHAVIMAGGSGTRFWPLSRRERPKQCLALGTAKPLIVETSHRIEPLVAIKNQLIVASGALKEQLTSLYPNASMPKFLWEPCARNTAPCIGLAALLVHQEDPDGVMVVLPSDHHVDDEEEFREALITASEAAANGDIVTLGIVPTRAERGSVIFKPQKLRRRSVTFLMLSDLSKNRRIRWLRRILRGDNIFGIAECLF